MQHLRSLVVAHSIFSYSMQTLSCSMWDLVPCLGIEPRPPVLGVQSLNHWTTRESPLYCQIKNSNSLVWLKSPFVIRLSGTSPIIFPNKYLKLLPYHISLKCFQFLHAYMSLPVLQPKTPSPLSLLAISFLSFNT